MNRSSNACRALAAAGLDGRARAGAAAGEAGALEWVSRSTVTRASKYVQLLRASFGDTRFGIGWAHSSVRLVSNHVHCAQLWRSAAHLVHWVSKRMDDDAIDVPQRAHFSTSRKAGMLTTRGSRGP
ncbi:MAG: hypothetical protein OXG72_07020 [Acidobacteria bacterium]|nr:hypothetical protein [Acidobacteriota bacterium]